MINNKALNIVFDFGGVLVDWNPRYLYHAYFNHSDEMELFLNHPFKEVNELLDGGLSLEDVLKDSKYAKYEKLLKIYVNDFSKSFSGTIGETEKILYHLKRLNIPLYGLTNWSAETFPWARNYFSFMEIFQGIIVSGDEKIKKPDPEIYQLLTTRFKLIPENTIFIDDKLENIIAAEKEGWQGIHFINPNDLKLELMKKGIICD